MYGQMTAGSWIYIGTQGIVQGTYETFAAIAEQRFDGSLPAGSCVTAGCGGMGGAQPLAVAMLDGVCLIADVDPHHLVRRVETRYLDLVAPDLDTALREVEEAKSAGEGRSIGLVMTANELHAALRARGVVPDIVTDQTAAHDPARRLRAGRPLARAGGRAARVGSAGATSSARGPRWPARSR